LIFAEKDSRQSTEFELPLNPALLDIGRLFVILGLRFWSSATDLRKQTGSPPER